MVMAKIINWLRETKNYAVFGSVAGNIVHFKHFSTQREAEQGVFDYFSHFETVRIAIWRLPIRYSRSFNHFSQDITLSISNRDANMPTPFMLNWLPRQDVVFVVTTTYPNVFDVAIFNTLSQAMQTAYVVANDIERDMTGQSFTDHSSLVEIIGSEPHVEHLPQLVHDGTETSLGPQFNILYNVYLDYSDGTYGLTVQIGKL
jgi:hypothetical protein